MPIYEITSDSLTPVEATSFEQENLKERQDLQRLLKANIEAISPDTLIIAEEYGDFVESNRRIDLLGIDTNANLVVIELKRDDLGGHMELQAIRYAAMVANLTWDQAINAYKQFLTDNDQDADAESSLLSFLGWDSPSSEDFAQETRIVLAARNFSKEITTSVLWLNDRDLDITCVRLNPLRFEDHLLLNVEQIIPLPEAVDYQVNVRHKKREERAARTDNKDRSLLSLHIDGEPFETGFKKSNIGYLAVKALEHAELIDEATFEFLRNNTSCAFRLLKTLDEITDNEEKYRRYRTQQKAEFFYQGQEYYIARNWGVSNITPFIREIENRFPRIKITID
ncbi:hypothetical protein [Endozoicomonas sp. ONNA1]|uniref:hypothetical protein n=1 Tax=Endozoicomonas sp. ONNA1 TaxID=2828740 RepID=UPI002148D378|nr:hypothetical protein [Endozoicomonas sp. ONNA1]